jgi:hypothetical protein
VIDGTKTVYNRGCQIRSSQRAGTRVCTRICCACPRATKRASPRRLLCEVLYKGGIDIKTHQ